MAYDNSISRTDVAGLIPSDESSAIIQNMTEASVCMRTFRRVTMPSGVTTMPVLSVLPTAYWIGTTDTGLKQTTEQNWENVTLTARELAVIVPIPQAVLDDASVDLWAEIRPRLSEAFGAAIDAAALFGTSAPSDWPDSIVEDAVSASNEYTAGTGVDLAADINETWALVEADGFDVNVQYARRNIRSRLRGLRDQNDALLFSDYSLAVGRPASIYGEDLLYVSNGAWSDTYDLIVGDRNAAILGLRQDMRYEMFREGIIQDAQGTIVLNLMQQDAVALRATMRVGYAVANPANKIAGDGGASGAGFPFAVLTAAAS